MFCAGLLFSIADLLLYELPHFQTLPTFPRTDPNSSVLRRQSPETQGDNPPVRSHPFGVQQSGGQL